MTKLPALPTGDLKDCGCGPGDDEVKGLSGVRIEKLERAPESLGDRARVEFAAAPRMKRPRKPRSKGAGAFCVLSHKGNVVHCYHDKSTAARVAERFGERTGTTFKVKKRGAE
jgi:hypothetical protein